MSNAMESDVAAVVEQMNETFLHSLEENVAAQSALVESWSEALEASLPEEETISEGIEGYTAAIEVFLEGTEELVGETTQAMESGEVDPRAIRDIWLRSSNEALKELMSTTAFAAANGEFVDSMLELDQEIDELTQDSLADVGIATRDDVGEVAERLIELERRQHEVERKLDTILEVLEE